MSTSPTMESVSTKHVNAQDWLKDRLCGLGLDDFRPDGIAIYTSLQLAVPDELSDVTYTISGRALTPISISASQFLKSLNLQFRGNQSGEISLA